MTDIQQQPYLRNRLWIGGKFFVRDPSPIQFLPRRFETLTKTSNLTTRVDRPYPIEGLPNVLTSYDFQLPWPTLVEPGLLEHLDMLVGKGQPFDLGVWKQHYDIYDGDSATVDFLLQRRQLMPVVTPPAEFPDYPTRVIRFDKTIGDPTMDEGTDAHELTVVAKTFATIGTGSPGAEEAWIETDGHLVGSRRTASVRLGTAPPNLPDTLAIIYVPRFAAVVKKESPRIYAEKLREPRGIELTEA